MFTSSSVSEFGPELMESGRGDLLVQAVPPRGLAGALESRFTTGQKRGGANMEAVVPVPLLSHCPQPFRFSSSRHIEVPSQLLSCNSRVLVGFSVFCDVRGTFQYFASLPSACC